MLLYVIVALFQFAGMRRGRATLEQYFFWPFSSLATMVVVGLSISILIWLLGVLFGAHFAGMGGDLLAALLSMLGGYIGGLYWAARGRPMAAEAGRGAVVLDGQQAQVAT